MLFSKVLSVSTCDKISSHILVVADLNIPTNYSLNVPQTIEHHKLKAINIVSFKAAIKYSKLGKYHKTNPSEFAQQCDSVLNTLFALYALVRANKISPKPHNPWMTLDILASNRHNRYPEHICYRTQTGLQRSRLIRQIHLCNRQVAMAK